jgi:hypothetical protein
MSEDTIFPAGETTPGQAQSRRAYKDILVQLSRFAWWQDYQELTARGWDWRKAIYIAWAASPAQGRIPPTQAELAKNVLGLSSDRTIRTWHERMGDEIDAEIARMQAAPLLKHRRDVIETTLTVALTPNEKGHQDRKLVFQLLGDLDKGKQPPESTVSTGGGPMTLEEWRRLAADRTAQADAAIDAAGEGDDEE